VDLDSVEILYQKRKYIITDKKEEYIFNYIKSTKNFFELNILKTISSYDYKGIYVDIGSNIGNHSLFFANHCRSTKVYSIECFPETYNILNQNIDKNNTDVEIIPLNCAIGDRIGTTYIIRGKQHNSGTNKTTDEKTKFEVELTTLDNLFDINSTATDIFSIQHNNIAVIKIDVEGDELKVINGSLKLIEKNQPLIIIEVHPKKRKTILKTHKENLKCIMDKLPHYKIKNEFSITYILESKERKLND